MFFMEINEKRTGFFQRLKEGLAKTRTNLLGNIDRLLLGKKVIDQELFDELEEILITADVGAGFTQELILSLREKASRDELADPVALKRLLQDEIRAIFKGDSSLVIPKNGLFAVMVLGVNGTGKTTTVAKMAYDLKNRGYAAMIAAADTFRSAAIEQIEVWSERIGVPLVKQQAQADPSAVVFDALRSAKAGKAEVLLVDTAGRLHTKVNLMEELKKMKRVMARELPGAPHEVILVVDATTGQNTLAQARMFHEELGVTGLVVTKLDGTAKGGVVIRIVRELNIPIRYLGVGEGLDDLKAFNGEEFVDALFKAD